MQKQFKFSIWYVLLGIWFFLMKRMTSQQLGFMTLGKNKAKIYMQLPEEALIKPEIAH